MDRMAALHIFSYKGYGMCLASLPCQSSKANEIVVGERDIKTPTTFAHEAKVPLLSKD